MSDYIVPDSPKHLNAAGRNLYQRLCLEFELEGEDSLTLATLAAEAADRETQCRRKIRDEGLTITDRFGQPKAHPALAVEHKARTQLAAILAQLHRQDVADERLLLAVKNQARLAARQAAQDARSDTTGRRRRN